jgi:hypothetical protein
VDKHNLIVMKNGAANTEKKLHYITIDFTICFFFCWEKWKSFVRKLSWVGGSMGQDGKDYRRNIESGKFKRFF